MVKAKAKANLKENSVSFNDISQVVNKNHQVLNNFLYKNTDRLKSIGKVSESAYGSLIIRSCQKHLRSLQKERN